MSYEDKCNIHLQKLHTKEFDARAQGYNERRVIQNALAQTLTDDYDAKGKVVVDIGCGSGAIFERVCKSASFIGIDISPTLLALHPTHSDTRLLQADFDDVKLYEQLSLLEIDTIFSNSSLQWSANIEAALLRISSLADECRLSIFTDGTFSTIRRISGVKSFLSNADYLIKILNQLGFETIDRHEYVLHFDDKREMFGYIKKSGISGGETVLDFKTAKKLRDEYPYDYLEFEALTAIRSKSSFSAS